jgi:hypothetical protein
VIDKPMGKIETNEHSILEAMACLVNRHSHMGGSEFLARVDLVKEIQEEVENASQ